MIEFRFDVLGGDLMFGFGYCLYLFDFGFGLDCALSLVVCVLVVGLYLVVGALLVWNLSVLCVCVSVNCLRA